MVESIYFLKPAWCGSHFAGLWPEQGLQPVTRATALRRWFVTFVSPLGYHAFGGYGATGLPREEVLNATPTPPDPRRPKWTAEEAKKVTELSEKDVLSVLALVEKEYSVDTSRVYLMGHSM